MNLTNLKKPGAKKQMRLYFLISLISLICLAKPVFAQVFDIASTYIINDKGVKQNDIVSSIFEKGLVRSDIPYDNRMFGIYQEKPLLVYRESTNSGQPVVRQGDVLVNVSNLNGKISPGDFITSSAIPGVGMRASQSGYVLGIATSQVTPSGTYNFLGRSYQTGIVKLALRIEYAEIDKPRSILRLLEYFNAALFYNVQNPERFTNLLKYILAALIAITALLVGFFTFARNLSKGIEAIGRNPLASRSIQFSIVLSLLLTVTTIAIGLVLSLIVLRI